MCCFKFSACLISGWKKNNKIKCLQLFCCFKQNDNCLLYQWCIKFVGICLFWGLLTFIHLTMLVVVGCSEAAIDSVFISGLKPHFFFLQLVILHSVWSNRIIVSILFYYLKSRKNYYFRNYFHDVTNMEFCVSNFIS
jgi:hypothetical protein